MVRRQADPLDGALAGDVSGIEPCYPTVSVVRTDVRREQRTKAETVLALRCCSVTDSPDCGSPISYLVLGPGTPIYASGNERIGTVEQVLYVETEDVFDGIVIRSDGDLRFVDADQVDQIYERCVITSLTAEEARRLPPPAGGPPVFQVDPAEATGRSFGDRVRRLFGKGGGWKKRPG